MKAALWIFSFLLSLGVSRGCLGTKSYKKAEELCPEDGQRLAGDLLRQSKEGSLHQCQAQCQLEPHCNFVTWDQTPLLKSGTCNLFFSIIGTSEQETTVIPKECPRGKSFADEPRCAPESGKIEDTKSYVDYQVCKASLGSFTDANNRLLSGLYRHISSSATPDSNLFWCQACVISSLALIYDGSNGTTLKQLTNAVFTSGFPQLTRNGYKIVRDRLEAASNADVKLFLPNKLFLQEDFEVKESYLNTSRSFYGAEPEELDFGDSKSAVKSINQWISNATRGGIDNVVSDQEINSDARMTLISAAYLEAKWEKTFDAGSTRPDLFNIGADKAVTVQMMMTTGQYRSRDLTSIRGRALEMPYKGKQLSMVFVLPEPGFDWTASESKIAEFLFTPIRFRETPRAHDVLIPKFNFSSVHNLQEPLRSLGLVDMWDRKKANFQNMVTGNDLFVSSVIQKAAISVDEMGTVASAANTVTLSLKSARPTFNCNRPFLFLIQDNRSGMVVFAGRVMDPTKN